MSKTRKTRPLLIRMSDQYDNGAGVTEKHNHKAGECDLPETVIEQFQGDARRNLDTNCYYAFRYTGHKICPCGMCSGKFYRKRPGKEARQAAKKAIKEQLD